jgi:DNA polymerase-3 subunit epsilon
MRQIILDTETTGLEHAQGHRIIEIGCVEVKNRRKTERCYHQYLNPERDIEDGAFEVHGISNENLADKPVFRDIAQDFINFIRDSELIIHNAPFDVGFINAELQILGSEWGQLEDYCTITDTLVMAREMHPGQRNSLDALCKRYKVDNSQRELHGALLDAQILLDVYLAMTGGQTALFIDDSNQTKHSSNQGTNHIDPDRPRLRIIEPTSVEMDAHRDRLDKIEKESEGQCIWLHMGKDK